MSNCLIFKDLDEIAVEKDRLSAVSVADKWLVVPYETGDFAGKMLAACENAEPEEVTLKFGVRGWYKVYLGLTGINGVVSTGIAVKSTESRDIVDFIHDMSVPEYHWAPYTFMREYFYKPVDFSADDTLTLFKPSMTGIFKSSILCYVKLVKMTDEEIADYNTVREGRVNFHFDVDFFSDCDYKSRAEFSSRVRMLKGAGSGILFLEDSFDDCDGKYDNNIKLYLSGQNHVRERMPKYLADLKNIRGKMYEDARELGFKVYGAHRMEIGDFFFPYGLECYNNRWQEQYPRFRCRTRDGREINVLSYAYPEVRKMMVDKLVALSDGADGMSLILHRGVFVAFEKPVADAVKAKYGVDAARLPVGDCRLQDVCCSFMTDFMRELRRALPSDKKINVIVFYNPESSKKFGLDIETWVKEKLADSVSQGIMEHYEDIDDCIDKDGLVDLDKYREIIKVRQPVKRTYDDSIFDYIAEGSERFLKICDKYGAEYFGTLGWEHMSPESTLALAERQKKAGVKKFISWDGNHKAKRMPVFNAEKYLSLNYNDIGEKEQPEFVKFRRILSVCGRDISSFNPNWRG